jgi:hypothetical protein
MQTEVDTQTPDERAIEVIAEPGSEDEAVALFNQRAQSKAQATPETPEDEPQATDDTEPDEGDPEESEAPTENLVEVEYEGKTYTVQPELQKALLRQSDYSRKMNEVGAKEKDYTQRIEKAERLAESAEKYAKVLAKVELIDANLAQFQEVDFDRLEVEDPARYSILAVKHMKLLRARETAASEANGLNSQIATERAAAVEAKRLDMLKALQKDLPGWGEELGTKVSQYALSSGFSVPEIQQFTDPRLVIALDKARKFDAIQSGKAAALSKSKDAPQVLKPGAKRTVSQGQEAMQRFQKSNSPEDAVAVFQARAARR